MSSCEIEAISALLDGELPENEAALLFAHMEECPACRALYQDFTALRDGFTGLDIQPPDTFAPGTVYRLGLGEEPPRRRRVIASLLGVAACLVAVFVISQNMAPPDAENDLAPAGIPENESGGSGLTNEEVAVIDEEPGAIPMAPQDDGKVNDTADDLMEEDERGFDLIGDTVDGAEEPQNAEEIAEPSPSPEPSYPPSGHSPAP